MVISDYTRFREIESAFGNKYVAAMAIAKASRKLGEETTTCHISESKLIQWVLTGNCPYSQSELDVRRAVSEKIDNLDQYLEFVGDEIVRQKVIEYYKQSVRKHKIWYCSEEQISKGKQARINILLRMIWYNFTT